MSSLLLSPINAYIDTLIIPTSQYRGEACQRAFGPSGRMQSLIGRRWLGGFSFYPFDVKTTDIEFAYSRRGKTEPEDRNAKADYKTILKGSDVTAVWSAQSPTGDSNEPKGGSQTRDTLLQYSSEVLIKGRLQGWKEGDPRGASRTTRKKMWQAVVRVLSGLSIPAPENATYEGLKSSDVLKERRNVKAEATVEALKGWIHNVRDDFPL